LENQEVLHFLKAQLKKTPYKAKGVEYPYFRQPAGVNHIHQADFAGPGYIKNHGKFYSLNIIWISSAIVFTLSLSAPNRTLMLQYLCLGAGKLWGCPKYFNLIMN